MLQSIPNVIYKTQNRVTPVFIVFHYLQRRATGWSYFSEIVSLYANQLTDKLISCSAGYYFNNIICTYKPCNAMQY